MGSSNSTYEQQNINSATENSCGKSCNNIETNKVKCEKINMRNVFIDKLNTFGHEGKKICELLETNKSVIAGSFPLQVLSDVEFESSDIDIFTCDPNFNNHLEDMGYIKTTITNYEHQFHNGYISTRYKNPNIKKVLTFSKKTSKHPIQTILLDERVLDRENDDMMKKYISDTVDLDLCKIIFDGKNVHKCDNNSFEERLCTFPISRCQGDNDCINATFDRIKKYALRGYNTTITA